MPALPVRTRLAVLAILALSAGPVAAQDGDAGAYLAARAAVSDSNFREAAGWYTRALISDPSNPALLEGAIVSNIALGDFELAADIARRLLQTGEPNQIAHVALIAENAKAGRFADILADADAGQTIGPLIDGLVRSWAEFGDGRMSEALQGFDSLTGTEGYEAFGLYHKALALASAGDYEGADEIMSGRAAGRFAVTRRGIIAHAQILSQLEENQEAIRVLDASFGTEPDPQIDALRARLSAGEPVPYDIARNATDGIAEIFYTLASALNGEVENGFTMIYARTAAYLRPDHAEAVLLTADIFEAQGQYDLAVETYAQIPPDHTAFHAAEIGRAEVLFASDRREASIEVLQSLTRSHGDLLVVHVALADALRRDEQFVAAIKAYDAAVALIDAPEERHWTVFYSRGICRERQAEWDAAEADFRKALELRPDQPQVLNYLGYSFVDRGVNLDEALGMIERAVAAEPQSGYIIDSLAWAYFRLGRFGDAVAPMERASVLEPVDPIVTDHLGDVYWSVGRTLEAQFQWRRALSFDPEEKDAVRIRRKLEIGLDAVLAEEGAAPLKPVDAADADQ